LRPGGQLKLTSGWSIPPAGAGFLRANYQQPLSQVLSAESMV